MDYYNEAFGIIDALAAEGLITESKAIQDAIESCSTATEILMRLRWQMQQIHAAKNLLLPDTRRRIESLIATLDRELSG